MDDVRTVIDAVGWERAVILVCGHVRILLGAADARGSHAAARRGAVGIQTQTSSLTTVWKPQSLRMSSPIGETTHGCHGKSSACRRRE